MLNPQSRLFTVYLLTISAVKNHLRLYLTALSFDSSIGYFSELILIFSLTAFSRSILSLSARRIVYIMMSPNSSFIIFKEDESKFELGQKESKLNPY